MTTLTVMGMHCKSCVMLIQDSLEDLGVTKIKIELDEKKQIGKVSFEYKNTKKVVEAIEKEGYKVIV